MKNISIIFVGMPGVGKSTIGKTISKFLKVRFIDLDQEIEKEYKMSLQAIIDKYDEKYLSEIEKERMQDIDLSDKIISPGGSIVYHRELMEYLKSKSILIYLKDSLKNIESRVGDTTTRGIIGIKEKSFEEIYNEREHLYTKYSHITINCNAKSEKEIIEEVLKKLNSEII